MKNIFPLFHTEEEFETSGYIKIPNNILRTMIGQHPLLLQVWLWLLFNATPRKKYSIYPGPVDLNPGQLVITKGFIINEIPALTRARCKAIFHFLETVHKITIKTTNRYTLITILDWEKYYTEAEDSSFEPEN